MKRILEERGINTFTLKADDMRIILANHDDFRNEKTVVERFFLDQATTFILYQSFTVK